MTFKQRPLEPLRTRKLVEKIAHLEKLLANYERLTAELVASRDSAYETIAALKAELAKKEGSA